MILIYLIAIPFGILLLVQGAKMLVNFGVRVASRTGIPKFVIGLTLISFGTSLPELVVSVIGSANQNSDLVIGNLLGSSIANILLITALAAIIRPIAIKKLVATRDIPFAIASIFIFALLFYDRVFGEGTANVVSRGDGIVFLVVFLVFLYYVAFSHKNYYEQITDEEVVESLRSRLGKGMFGLVLLITGGVIFLQSSIALATSLGLSEKFIGLTIIAVGTSLMELVTMLVAISKKEDDLGLGIIVGSNIFNILFIMGLTAIINPLVTGVEITSDVVVLFVATVMLLLSLFTGKRNKVDKTEGIVFLLLYFAYLVWSFFQ